MTEVTPHALREQRIAAAQLRRDADIATAQADPDHNPWLLNARCNAAQARCHASVAEAWADWTAQELSRADSRGSGDRLSLSEARAVFGLAADDLLLGWIDADGPIVINIVPAACRLACFDVDRAIEHERREAARHFPGEAVYVRYVSDPGNRDSQTEP
jgi:hypothetical protein